MKIFDANMIDSLNRIQLKFVFLGHSTVNKSWRGRVEAPTYSRLYYVAGGSAVITAENERHQLIPGKWYLLPSGMSFDYECEKSLNHVFFHLRLCGMSGLDLLGKCGSIISVSDFGIAKRIANRSFCGLSDALELRGLIMTVLGSMLENQAVNFDETTLSPCTAAAIRFINDNASFALTPEQVAESAFVSKSTLDKHFRAELGTSVGKYIDDAVFFEALRLISIGGLSLRDISERLGFSDQFYFSKKFKARYGITPREYKKKPLA